MKTHTLRIRNRLSTWFLIFAVLCSAATLYGVNVGHKPPEPPPENKNPDPCEKPGSNAECLKFAIPFPLLPHEAGIGSQFLRVHRDDPSPALFTPQSLVHTSKILTYVSEIVAADDLDSGIAHDFTITNEAHIGMQFQVNIGSSIANPVGVASGKTMRVRLLDENKQPTTEDPVFYRLLPGDGSAIDYPVGRGRIPVWMRDQNGRILDLSSLSDVNIELILEEGFYRQIKSVSGLVDIVSTDDFGYEIRFYTLDKVNEIKNDGLFEIKEYENEGVYAPYDPYRVIRIENPTGDINNHHQVRIVDTHGSYSKTDLFTYVPAAEDWQLTEGEGDTLRTEQILITTDTSTGNQIRTTELLDGSNQVISRVRQIIQSFAWNKAVIEEIKDPDGLALTKTFEYYTNSSETGRYAKEKLVVDFDGSWTHFDYDSEGRVIQEITPWQDGTPTTNASQAVEKTFSYAPVDSNDTLDDVDTRPRRIIVNTLGVETSRRYFAYFTDSSTGELVEIEEEATVQGAAYGAASSLRTTQRYYPSNDSNPAAAGRLKSITHPDGTVELYTYEQATPADDFVETRDTLALVGGTATPIAGKSLRTVTTSDPRGNRISEQSYVYHDSTWQALNTRTWTYSDELTMRGFLQESAAIDGRPTLNQTWHGPLLASRTDESGSVTVFDYDALERLEFETLIGHDGREDVVIHYDRTLGAIDCGCDGSAVVTRSAGTLELTSHKKTDAVGRHSEMLDENGYLTTFSYQNDGRITTEHRPDGTTRITTRYRDGRIQSITGTGVIPEYFTYGVNSDGSQWTRVDMASSSSPRYRIATSDLAGRLISETTPAFGGGTFTRTMHYNDRGLLAKTSQPGQADTLYEYDDLANLIRSGLDRTASGTLVPASADRITETDTLHQQIEGDWFAVTTTTVYPETDSAAAITVSTSKRRLSGFSSGSHGKLAAEQISIDLHDNQTTQETWIDRANKTVTRESTIPGSNLTAQSTTVNGLLMSQSSHTVSAPVTFEYDALRRRTATQQPHHAAASSISYIPYSNLIASQTDAAGNTTHFTYYGSMEHGAGQIKSIENALGQMSYRAYDALGRPTHTWGETDYPQAYTYTDYGETETLTTWRDTGINFSTSTWPNPTGGDTTTWIYDEPTGLLTRKEYADTEGTDYTYTTAGQLATRTWARGVVTTYGYDTATGELTSVTYSDSTPNLAFTYNRLGQQQTITDATGSRSFDYDPATLQLTAENLDTTFYDDRILTMHYEDQNGLPGRPSGFEVGITSNTARDYGTTWSYDAKGRWQGVEAFAGSNFAVAYDYKADSNLLSSMTHSVASNAFAQTEYLYEANRDLKTQVRNQRLDGSTWEDVSRYNYRHDDLGRRTDVVTTGPVFNADALSLWGYNDRSEVIAQNRHLGTDPQNPGTAIPAEDFAYAYDPIGNRLSSQSGTDPQRNYTTNELNQYTELSVSAPPREPKFDKDGNLTDSGTGWYYEWNGENRLVEARDFETTAVSGSKRLSFVYDYMGRRVSKTVEEWNGTTWLLTSDLQYLYQGWNLILEIDDNQDVLKGYLWGMDLSGTAQGAGGVGGLLAMVDAQEAIAAVAFYDANGNLTQLYDWINEEVIVHYEYNPFGGITNQSGTYADANTFRFSTKYLDIETGFFYYGFRYYDPETGRWLNRDPIEEQGGLNLYGFVYNDPVNWWDLLGLEIQYFSHQRSPGPMHTVGQTDSHLGGGSSRQQGMSNISKDISTGKSIVSRIQDLNNITRGKSLTNIAIDRMKQFGKGLFKTPTTPMFWWSNWFEPAIEDLTNAPTCLFLNKGERRPREETGKCFIRCKECPDSQNAIGRRGQISRTVKRECDGFLWRLVPGYEVTGECSASCPDSHPHFLDQVNTW